MSLGPSSLLLVAVAAVGVFHTVVPDHWVPIMLLARQRGWSRGQTARAAAGAGVGHTLSTLAIGIVVWVAGVAFATTFGQFVNLVASIALIGFGGWIAVGAIRELRHAQHATGSASGHAHLHHHEGGPLHAHWHEHAPTEEIHDVAGNAGAAPPLHTHDHPTSARTALLLILGSSPMVEGIPAFFAAAKYGFGFIVLLSAVFAIATISTYVALCVASTSGLQRLSLGPLERYGEVFSGTIIAALGVLFLFWLR